MAAVLEILLDGEVSAASVVKWLNDNDNKAATPKCLFKLDKLKPEFIPYLLNYLRDQTLHLLQSSRSATPSPAKTPASLKKKAVTNKNKHEGSKRIQLFGASPSDILEEVKQTSSSVFNPESAPISGGGGGENLNPGLITPTERRGQGSRNSYSNKTSNNSGRTPQGSGNRTPSYAEAGSTGRTSFGSGAGSKTSPFFGKQNSESQRSKHRFSLGEYFVSSDKESPGPRLSGAHSLKNTPSPGAPSMRKSSGKKKGSSHKYHRDSMSPAPVFSLNSLNDFPPVAKDKESSNEAEEIRKCNNVEAGLSAIDMKNSPNFEVTPRGKGHMPITKSRRISFTTLATNDNSPASDVTGPSRRIKPTPVTTNVVRPQAQAFLLESDTDGRLSPSEERQLLRQEMTKHLHHDGDSLSCPNPATPSKLMERSCSLSEVVTASRAEVTYEDKLNTLADLYSQCLSGNMFPNITVELYFIFQLLTSRNPDIELVSQTYADFDFLEINFFSSVHNAVYFAVRVLEQQRDFLCYLDKGTVRLLTENKRLADFSETLMEWLSEKLTCMSCVPVNFPKSPIGGVSFQAETDNRKNFPNDSSFHLFKKQRDTFYELLREWESNHMSPGWSVVSYLGDRIRALVNFKAELANYIHFARLFQSQLITTMKGENYSRTEGQEENIALLTQLKRTNPEKFKRLQERFVMPFSVGGPCPNPSFPGSQEFFRDFIVAAASPTFNQHLLDTFVAKIHELNVASYTPGEVEATGGEESDDDDKDRFVSSLQTLRLIGKFLGFVTFLPYTTTSKVSEELEAMYIAVRRNNKPQIDLLTCLRISYAKGRLSLTVPWVVEFMSMMDSLAPHLDYLQDVLFSLLYIHRMVWKVDNRRSDVPVCYSRLLVITTISWLMDSQMMPEGFFFMEIPDATVHLMTSPYPAGLQCLDNMGFVDQKVYYACCPYLAELRALLVEFAVGNSSKTTTIRKITPISADDHSKPSVSERQTQLQLEENFFHNHPPSLRRTVEFIADRTASNFIKNIRGSIIHTSLVDAKTRLASQMEANAGGSPTGKAKDKLQYMLLKLAQESVADVKTQSSDQVANYCQKRVDAVMPLILPDEQSAAVIDICCKIALRQTLEKVTLWLNRHITTSMYQNELRTEMERILKALAHTGCHGDASLKIGHSGDTGEAATVCCLATEHHISAPNPSDVLMELKALVRNLTYTTVTHTNDEIMAMLEKVCDVLTRRQDIIPGVYKAYSQLVQDLAIATACTMKKTEFMLIEEKLISLWEESLSQFKTLQDLVCPRVVYTLQEANGTKERWDNYVRLLIHLAAEESVYKDFIQAMITSLEALQMYSEEFGLCMCEFVGAFPQHLVSASSPSHDLLTLLYHVFEGDNSVRKQLVILQSREQTLEETNISSDLCLQIAHNKATTQIQDEGFCIVVPRNRCWETSQEDGCCNHKVQLTEATVSGATTQIKQSGNIPLNKTRITSKHDCKSPACIITANSDILTDKQPVTFTQKIKSMSATRRGEKTNKSIPFDSIGLHGDGTWLLSNSYCNKSCDTSVVTPGGDS